MYTVSGNLGTRVMIIFHLKRQISEFLDSHKLCIILTVVSHMGIRRIYDRQEENTVEFGCVIEETG